MSIASTRMFCLLKRDAVERTLPLDREAILEVIERIEPMSPDTAKSLRSLADNFQVGMIRDLLGRNDED